VGPKSGIVDRFHGFLPPFAHGEGRQKSSTFRLAIWVSLGENRMK
jgi:hypothetical protein